MSEGQLKNIIEAALLAAGHPLSVDQIMSMFEDSEQPDRGDVRTAIKDLQTEYEGRGIEVKQVASGYRVQIREDLSQWITKLWEERPPRYSRALMETLALIAYRQPMTRGEIEEIRGVSVSTNIMRSLLDRNWVRIVGHRDVPGKPAMYGTTKEFLNYFSLKSLDELPPLSELRDFDSLNVELDLLPPEMVQKTDTESQDFSAADTMTREALEQRTGDTSIVPALKIDDMDRSDIETESVDEPFSFSIVAF